jgi:methionyl aminopeptidase
MIILKSSSEIAAMKQASDLVSRTLAEVARYIKPGVTTRKLDRVAEEFIRKHNAIPSFKGYGKPSNPFPATLCVSVNDQVVHGLPSDYVLKDDDIVSVDCGVFKGGFHGDQAYTFIVEDCSEETKNLLRTTMESLYLGIEQARHGNKVGDISAAIQNHCESRGYGVVRDLVGHGVGRSLHEEPSVPNYGKAGSGPRLRAGMTLAVEPMINGGTWRVKTQPDGWTVVTADGSMSAHYEHNIHVCENEAEILTNFVYIEQLTKFSFDVQEKVNG